MNSTDGDDLLEEAAQAATDVSLALLVIVQALKQQPGFDSNAFDRNIKRFLRDIDPEENELTVSILNNVLKL